MKVFDELDFNDISRTAWIGAVDTAERIEREGKGVEFCDMIEELYPDGIDRTALNDIMWFDSDWIFETLGISEEEEEEREDDENAKMVQHRKRQAHNKKLHGMERHMPL